MSPVPILRSAIAAAAGRRRAGSIPYYRNAAMAQSFPFQWSGWPGGQPSSSPAAETRELSGADLIESGANPYTIHYPALAHRGFHAPGTPLEGFWGDLSASERKVVKLGALAAVAIVGGLYVSRRMKKPRRNPARRRR